MRVANSRSKQDERPAWAKRLTDARKLTGMGPTEFSRKIGLSQQRYSNYEGGIREPNVNAWKRIVSHLPVDLNFIIVGNVRAGSGKMDDN